MTKKHPQYQSKPLTAQSYGFTLIELMAAVVIMSILISIAIPKYKDYRIHMNLLAVERTAAKIHMNQSKYYAKHGRFAQHFDQLNVQFDSVTDKALNNFEIKILAVMPGSDKSKLANWSQNNSDKTDGQAYMVGIRAKPDAYHMTKKKWRVYYEYRVPSYQLDGFWLSRKNLKTSTVR